jgi:transcription elongation factor Elf1
MAKKKHLKNIRRCPTCATLMHAKTTYHADGYHHWHVCNTCGETIEINEVTR